MEDLDDTEFDESEHNRLISAVTKLDKTQHIKDPTRNEPTNLNSEFNLIKSTTKLDLGNVVKVLENTANHVQISKKLKKTQDTSRVLPKPLEKPQAERIKRSTGYGEAKTKVGRWDAVVARSRTLDYVSFPIKHVSNKMQPTQDFLSKLKSKSPLELELEEIDPPAPVEEDDDEEQTYPMTYEEMVEQRQHMAKMRAQQSFKAAKAKRQSKIKSKKYHRILKKEKLKQQLKEFEELQKTNPEEALSKLEALEKARALERHTLRHKNTGKWAKSKLIRAKYDKETRAELAEQLAVSRGLTKKAQNDASSDDDDEAVNSVGIPDISLAQDPNNPWMMKQSHKSNVDAEFDFGYKKYLKDKMLKRKVDSDSDSDEEPIKEVDETENVATTRGKEMTANKTVAEFVLTESIGKVAENKQEKQVKTKRAKITKKNLEEKHESRPAKIKEVTKKQKKAPKLVATSNWAVESMDDNELGAPKITSKEEDIDDVFDSIETKVMGKVEKKLKNLRHNIERLEKSTKERKDRKKKTEDEKDNLEYLSFKSKVKPIIDEQLMETTIKTPVGDSENITPAKILKSTEPVPQHTLNPSEANIDPSRFIEVKPKYLNSAISEGVNEYDLLDDEQVVPKVNIEEVFEEDDVVDSFRQEKEDEANKDAPQDIDLSLPGWGSWGGKGVKAPKRKRNRFIIKAPPKMPRRDENKGDIIIKEYKDPKLLVHKVKELPFPFTSVKEYEASIRAPLGNTFIPERAHKLLIRPSVITKAGAIIEPMDEDELLVRKNVIFNNANIVKLLAKK